MTDFFEIVRQALQASDMDQKLQLTRQAAANAIHLNKQRILDGLGEAVDVYSPGRPAQPILVQAGKLPKRAMGSLEGRIIMMHAIAHIEFNAINLALDAVQRFEEMPLDYYRDWIQVAEEEAYHFELIRTHLRHLGGEYGDYPAHNGLWEMAETTAHDVLDRMALVPRVLEARGLDVTPNIQKKMRHVGDNHAATLLDIIFKDEIGHVKVGSKWFRYICKERRLKPTDTFFTLVEKHFPRGIDTGVNLEARKDAGFSEDEIKRLLA
ncbi:MAG: ferritin-like domain-containing protein [Mariprofundaceae bacterium]|nr:ferritin-like domain-containing protein [Mariprofundaceae bacterium]MDQ6994231.1 ferritin-like domain-containing protein [Mariprofundaceae bacterium]